jgi:hypothetical protein
MTVCPLQMSNEQQLLLACLNAAIDPGENSLVLKRLTQEIDWECFAALAERHRVTPTVWSVLKSSTLCAEVPCTYLISAKHRTRQNNLKNLQSASVLIELTRRLQQHGIRIMVLKGIGMAMQTYPEWSKRHAGDIDLFIHEKDLAKATHLLIAFGFRRVDHDSEPGSAKFNILVRNHCHLIFGDVSGQIRIELHWRLTRDLWDSPLSFESVWKHRHPIVMAGCTIETLSLPHAMLFGCYHGAAHGWQRIFWLYDIALGLNRFSDADWNDWMVSAHQLHLERFVAAALGLLQMFFNLRLPSCGYQMTDACKSLEKALGNTARLMFIFDGRPYALFSLPNLYRLQHDWIIRKGIKNRMAFIGNKIMPSLGDLTAVPLPDAAALLYYPFKPIIWLYRKIIPAIQCIAHDTVKSDEIRR